MRRLVGNGARVNGANKDGITPLMLASAAGRTETVRELVRLGADVNIKAHRYPGDTALYYAVLNNHPEVIKILLDTGADPHTRMGAYSMLGIAASSSSVDMLSALLTSQKLDINVRDASGNTPDMLVMLSDAPLEQKVASLKLLMGRGCDPTVQNSVGKNSCSIACEDKRPQILDVLHQCNCN